MWSETRLLSEDFVTQWTLTKCGLKMFPLSEDFVTQQTLTKHGPKCAPHWRTLSCCGIWPNVVQNVPLIRGLCHAADFNQMWSEMCPSSEQYFVTLWTLTKCGLICAPLWRTLSRCGLCSVMVWHMPRLKKWQSSSRGWHKQLVSGVIRGWSQLWRPKPPDNVRVIEPEVEKNDASCIHHTREDKWCAL